MITELPNFLYHVAKNGYKEHRLVANRYLLGSESTIKHTDQRQISNQSPSKHTYIGPTSGMGR